MRAWLGIVVIGVLVLVAAPIRADEAEDAAVRVYRALRPSVVSIENEEGSGSGVILDADGLILTNAHVVSSPLPFSVKVDADSAEKGSDKPAVYKSVKVVGYHATLDLALIRIDPKEQSATLRPVTIAKVKGEPGQRIFAIGNPAAGDGVILAKSITGGILSGVDREVDGERYYQIDAAINPGNSGGPIVDSAGNVLGIVTFKFQDAQAISFAIPINGMDFKSFVALSKRTTDPAHATKLLELAERFENLAEQAKRIDGPQSVESKRLDYYAAMCFRMALAYNPRNAAAYYSVGMILRNLDDDKIAAAYLMRAVQLEPWDVNMAAPYRELGFSLVKSKRDEKAVVAWNEGLAKTPYAAKIWEDLAIYYIQHRDFPQAARCASTALLIADKETRTQVMTQVRKDALAGLDGDAREKAEQAIEPKALTANLDKLLETSNAARKKREVYLTPAFTAMVNEFGGADQVGDVRNGIPQQPVARLKELERYDEVAEADAPEKPLTKPKKSGNTRPAKPADSDDDDWIGAKDKADSKSTTMTAKNKGGPQPTVTGEELGGQSQTVVDATFKPIKIDDTLSAVWSSDAKFAFFLQNNGVLHKVAVPSLVEERRLEIGHKCSGITRTKAGLGVAVNDLQEVWVIDESLTRLSVHPVAGVGKVVGCPSTTILFAAASDGLAVIDSTSEDSPKHLTTQEIVNQRGVPQGAGVRFNLMAITLDGKYFFCEGNECIQRLRIKGKELIYEQGGPRIGANPQAVVVSNDSRYVAMPSGGGNGELPGFARSPYSTFVFKVSDIEKPITQIPSGAYPRSFGFDAAARLLYTANFQNQLITFTPAGDRVKEYAVRDAGETSGILVHPDGKKLILTGGKPSWVELP